MCDFMKTDVGSAYIRPEILRQMVLEGAFKVKDFTEQESRFACYLCKQLITRDGVELSRTSEVDGANERYFLDTRCYSPIVN